MKKQYDLDEVIDRRGTGSLKYDFGMQRMGREDLLPLWVADMDFKLPEEILEELEARVRHGIFGYTDPDQEYFDALNSWFSAKHGYSVDPQWVTVGCGVVYALATSVRAFTAPGDKVLITQPVYYPFRAVIEDNGRVFVNSQLRYENGRYTVDYEDFEKQIVSNDVKMFILCNPHNPVGRVWTKGELEQMLEICRRHEVMVLADEIHCDFTYPGYHTTSVMTLDEKYRGKLALFTSPSKTFNIAGLQPANIIIPDENLRKKYRQANDAAGYSQGNVMALTALKACYTKGLPWHEAVLEYITANMEFMRSFVKERLPKAYFVEPEGTYLTWVDFSGYGFTEEELEHVIVEEAHLWLDSGKIFGSATAQFERFNIACPGSILKQALEQLAAALENHRKWD